jgi:hypothetical protein
MEPMNDKEVSAFLKPHLAILRAIRESAGDREIIEARNAVSAIAIKFTYGEVQAYARRALDGLAKALKYVDYGKKQETVTEAAQHFLDRIESSIRDSRKYNGERERP